MKGALIRKEEITCSKNIRFYYTCSTAMDFAITGWGQGRSMKYIIYTVNTHLALVKQHHIKAILLPTKPNHYYLKCP